MEYVWSCPHQSKRTGDRVCLQHCGMGIHLMCPLGAVSSRTPRRQSRAVPEYTGLNGCQCWVYLNKCSTTHHRNVLLHNYNHHSMSYGPAIINLKVALWLSEFEATHSKPSIRVVVEYSREFALPISFVSLGSSQILFLPHLSTAAASRFCSRSVLEQKRQDFL